MPVKGADILGHIEHNRHVAHLEVALIYKRYVNDLVFFFIRLIINRFRAARRPFLGE
jgi:hypothetical protein